MKPLIVGMCAHVDAGKTTLCEALLYQSGKVKTQGSVDHGSTVLDCDPLERQRGITITAKEAFFTWRDYDITLLDTPGHRDFSASLEHTLTVLDAAVLVISATDPYHPYGEQLFHRLQTEKVPTILFVNKMDVATHSRSEYMEMIQCMVGTRCLNFSQKGSEWEEELALCSDALLETYMKKGNIDTNDIAEAVGRREVIPVFFGSALKQTGIHEFLDAMIELVPPRHYGATFAAQVYKITHDENEQRLTHLKIMGGELNVKQKIGSEKVDQIRRYHGNTYEVCSSLPAGYVAAVKGLYHPMSGSALGMDGKDSQPLLSGAFTYRVLSVDGLDDFALMEKLRPLNDEDPSLRLHYDSRMKEVQLSLRGKVQAEVLVRRIQDRFGLNITFTPGRIAYRETIHSAVEGVGHIERLKHYAEVHVLLEPLQRNSGVQVMSRCPISMLEEARQQMLVMHLREHMPPGILSGSALSDIRITLIGVKTHAKHTDAQDLRDAIERAVRQGLQMTQCELLEPYISYQLYCPESCVAQAIYELENRGATYEISALTVDQRMIRGSGAYRLLSHYGQNVHILTKGQGTFMMSDDGYRRLENPQPIIAEIGYDLEQDHDYPCGSLFLNHGVAMSVPYDQVYEYMDLSFQAKLTQGESTHRVHRQAKISDEEWKRVTARIHSPRKQWQPRRRNKIENDVKPSAKPSKKKAHCLIVDGYNMIYEWPDLKELMASEPDAARRGLVAMLSNYQGYTKQMIIVVFDAYKTSAITEHIVHDHHLSIVYTKEAQTADAYIEKATHHLAKELNVSVATSDGAEQNIILGQGAMRISARELYERIQKIHKQAMKHQKYQPEFRHMALEDLRLLDVIANDDEKA